MSKKDDKQLNYWIGKPDNSVFKDMVDYCELVKEGLASNDIKRQKMNAWKVSPKHVNKKITRRTN